MRRHCRPDTEKTSPTTDLAGRFTLDLATDRWWWSDEVYRLHGFEPGDVIPTTDLMLAHADAADGAQAALPVRALAEKTQPGAAFGSTYRLLDAAGHRRTVAVVATARPVPPDGRRQVEGFMLDLTPGERTRLEADVRDAVASFRARAATIEQAKGILMELFALTADEAFEVLRECSNQANIKLFALAERLARHGPARPGGVVRATLADPLLARRLGLHAQADVEVVEHGTALEGRGGAAPPEPPTEARITSTSPRPTPR